MNKVQLLEALEDVEDYEEIVFVINSKNYTTLQEKVRVLNRDHRPEFMIHRTYLDLGK